MNRYHATLRAAAAAAVAATSLTAGSLGAQEAAWSDDQGRMELTSSAFTDGEPLPAADIYNAFYPGTTWNGCSATGAMGGDQSPPLAWRHAPHNTRSFAVVLYDRTAAFTHWGLYNIAADVRVLPEGAGAAGSQFGSQVYNDFGDPNYDGPCPPADYPPDLHHYVFTVYALDTELDLGATANFPANGEALYQALIRAGLEGHILASARLVALNSGSPPPAN
ncbi:MAG TPA: YbhB/YbcL family Raf kinase inhibitor-like protein [Steroidobacteraceae bacterium]|nr:YbhB/YbcL family Raf kinase inhibitor-like protein [Steroidobacteraceae bacterium]